MCAYSRTFCYVNSDNVVLEKQEMELRRLSVVLCIYHILAVSPRHACGRFEQKTAFMNLVHLT